MKCEKFEELLSSYLENELNSKEKKEVKTHLKECKSCSALLSAVKETTESLTDLPELDVNKDLLEKLYTIPTKKKKFKPSFGFFTRPALQPVFAVACVLLIVLSFYFFHPDRDYINKSIDRQVHLGYSKIQQIYVQAGALKDSIGENANNFFRSFEKLNPLKKSKEINANE